MRVSSRYTILLFGIINLLLPNGALSNNSTMYPRDFPMQPCDLANGKEGICVYGYLCRDSIINIDGNGIIDLRFSDVCEDYFLKCCSKETPCLVNTGTCVSASNCAVNLNDPNYKKFKQTDECDWSGYTCCPNDKIGQPTVQEPDQMDRESCDDDSLCVPYDQCEVNPDGDGLLEARLSDCSSKGQACCPKSKIKGRSMNYLAGSSGGQTNSIEQYEPCDDSTFCVLDDQCLVKPDGGDIIQARVSVCNGRNQTCCPSDQVKGYDPCSEVGGTCIPENSCPDSSSLKLDLRISQCDEPDFVCCMQDATDGRETFINKACSGGSGKCTPRKQCRGTTYRDTNKECGGLACCATLQISPSSTTLKPWDDGKDGKACFNNRGKCTKGSCVGSKYSDRKNECGGLSCCGYLDLQTTTTSRTTTTPEPDDFENEGQPCFNNRGKCTNEDCEGNDYNVQTSECGNLNCCADTEEATVPPGAPDRSCRSIGGQCMLEGNCQRVDSTVDNCGDNKVCCVQVVEPEIKACGYRNENGVKFGTINRDDGESQYGEFPWMVAIMVNENGKVKYACGGSLIDPEVVLTSAACVKSYARKPERLTVRAGEWDMGTNREPIPHEDRRVVKIKSHPDYKATTLANNIALIFLDDKFDLSSTINTVCLPPQNFVIDNGEVTASGWGVTPQDRTKYQQILKSIDLQYTERSECEQLLRKATKNRNFKLHPSFICAGGVAGLDTCRGDGGSPIVHPVTNDFDGRYYAVGMVSWGVGCGRAGMPAAYTDVAFFRDWIDKVIEQEGLHDHYYSYSKDGEAEE